MSENAKGEDTLADNADCLPFFVQLDSFGFVNFAETWNGRLAMLGFVIGLGTELLTGQGILNQLGF